MTTEPVLESDPAAPFSLMVLLNLPDPDNTDPLMAEAGLSDVRSKSDSSDSEFRLD